MGLEVTVLVVLLSWCSYMTEERKRERARELDGRKVDEAVSEKARGVEERRGETEVTGEGGAGLTIENKTGRELEKEI